MLHVYICTSFTWMLKSQANSISQETFNPFRHAVDCVSPSLLTDSYLKSDFLSTFLNIQGHLNLLQNGSFPLKFPPRTHQYYFQAPQRKETLIICVALGGTALLQSNPGKEGTQTL